jgi:hypothetical protein
MVRIEWKQLQKQTKLPLIAGILEIGLACVAMGFSSLVIGSWGLIIHELPALLFGLYGLVAFVVGLVGGFSALRREHFVLAVSGLCLLICWGVSLCYGSVTSVSTQMSELLFPVAIVLFAALSVVFLFTSKTEFI